MEKKVYEIKTNKGKKTQYVRCEPADNGKVVMMAKEAGLFTSPKAVQSAVVTEVKDPSKLNPDHIWDVYPKMAVLCFEDEDGDKQTVCIVRDQQFGTDDLRKELYEILAERLGLAEENDEDAEVLADFNTMIDSLTMGVCGNWLDYEVYYEHLDLI
jgi:hypothetical protein